jgi:hypothetical protein
MTTLQKDQTVEIYQDPITQKDFEGKAVLVREYRPDEGDGLSMWVVRFKDEPETTYTRTIYSPKDN